MADKVTKLRKRLRSYRSARLGCVFLATITWLVLVVSIARGEMESQVGAGFYAAAFTWTALVYICHVKLQVTRLQLAMERVCPKCEYDLRGCEGDACPECGWVFPPGLRRRSDG